MILQKNFRTDRLVFSKDALWTHEKGLLNIGNTYILLIS